MYESRYKPFDIQTQCRVYFTFVAKDQSEKVMFYDRPQTLPDETITAEAMVNAEKMKIKYSFSEFISIYIARTANEVNAFETYEYNASKSDKSESTSRRKQFNLKQFFAFALVVLISLGAGYFIGISQNNANISYMEQQPVKNYKSDYIKGWTAWFSHYGLNGSGKGIPYMNQYIYMGVTTMMHLSILRMPFMLGIKMRFI